jgi:hypothetical protein
MLILATFVFGFYKFCDVNASKLKYVGIVGFIHGFLHVFLMLITIWAITYTNYSIFGLRGNLLVSLAVSVQIFFVGGFLSGMLMGVYLWFCNYFLGIHDNEAFSSLKIEGYKNFLRMHIKDNLLTIYPLGVRKIAKWRFEKDAFVPDKKLAVELLEEPISIPLK